MPPTQEDPFSRPKRLPADWLALWLQRNMVLAEVLLLYEIDPCIYIIYSKCHLRMCRVYHVSIQQFCGVLRTTDCPYGATSIATPGGLFVSVSSVWDVTSNINHPFDSNLAFKVLLTYIRE